MSLLIRMDRTGHTTLAEWDAGDTQAILAAAAVLRTELDRGLFAVATCDRSAEQVRELPVHAPLVILRHPIAGG